MADSSAGHGKCRTRSAVKKQNSAADTLKDKSQKRDLRKGNNSIPTFQFRSALVKNQLFSSNIKTIIMYEVLNDEYHDGVHQKKTSKCLGQILFASFLRSDLYYCLNHGDVPSSLRIPMRRRRRRAQVCPEAPSQSRQSSSSSRTKRPWICRSLYDFSTSHHERA